MTSAFSSDDGPIAFFVAAPPGELRAVDRSRGGVDEVMEPMKEGKWQYTIQIAQRS